MTSPYRQAAPHDAPKSWFQRWLDSFRPKPRDTRIRCPDCGGEDWLMGPCGGLCQNVMCASCRKEFNHTPFGLERI